MGDREPIEACRWNRSWWTTVDTIKPYALAILIIAGLVFEVVVHFLLNISIVYTHFYYLIIVIAGLWYGRKAVWVALFFGALQISVSWALSSSFAPDSFFRALMLIIVAFVVGSIVETMNCYRGMLEAQNSDLRDVNEQLAESKGSFEIANKKLNLLSSITRHDIRNQLTALLASLELIRLKSTDPELIRYTEKGQAAAQAIERQIEFTKTYEDIGVRAPLWQDVRAIAERLYPRLPKDGITLDIRINGVVIYADPLLEKVFENLVDNSLRHGVRVSRITISSMLYGLGELAVVYEDDGIGIHEVDKERIFEKGFGKNTGLGLFLSREILAITGYSMKESGTYGKGVHFEILVPKGKYRFTGTGPENNP